MAVFIHLSDIHFGQEDKVDQEHKVKDIKRCLVDDVREVIRSLAGGRAQGIIVSGDLAFGGKPEEYQAAGEWLDAICRAAGCARHEVLLVPGNHDIDHASFSPAAEIILDQLARSSPKTLNSMLRNESNRELLLERFHGYRAFAEGYDCPLATIGGLESGWRIQLGETNRFVRIVGLNSALTCKKVDVKGELLLGAAQAVIPRPPSGEELVIVSHHPPSWLKDWADAQAYVHSRVRVLITGHEHLAKNEQNNNLLVIDAGATIPPNKDGGKLSSYSERPVSIFC